jgi:hypothetical protein
MRASGFDQDHLYRDSGYAFAENHQIRTSASNEGAARFLLPTPVGRRSAHDNWIYLRLPRPNEGEDKRPNIYTYGKTLEVVFTKMSWSSNLRQARDRIMSLANLKAASWQL